MNIRWIAWRIIREFVRDRRTVAFLLLVPFVVMTLIYFAVVEDESVKVGVVTRGVARLFDRDMIDAIAAEDNVVMAQLAIPDEETDPGVLESMIKEELRQRRY
jgi:hypothetical protein